MRCGSCCFSWIKQFLTKVLKIWPTPHKLLRYSPQNRRLCLCFHEVLVRGSLPRCCRTTASPHRRQYCTVPTAEVCQATVCHSQSQEGNSSRLPYPEEPLTSSSCSGLGWPMPLSRCLLSHTVQRRQLVKARRTQAELLQCRHRQLRSALQFFFPNPLAHRQMLCRQA